MLMAMLLRRTNANVTVHGFSLERHPNRLNRRGDSRIGFERAL
jgi:hypothetical protein